ncbi:uncharacterized protein AKAW2_31512A [Aspergillus luchuensis]|uniref:Uncharacterized protein n=2 Tax=Aspergillus subgen. Circumdati TaxID=2720871 RepID=A0A370BHN3_ASPNG|nr:uncharacterized protein AKAW2_31512A [Aspergillus luchuensis]KAI2812002.1 hypothetical protein CBS115989_10886 [Aspergillus niger]RDH13928.1 hypothetical protein M747DRAFT_347512 [Aspergillus niger ATCC 13496]GAA92644.1 similar to An08g11870 [Aspergillus luchuensis IFO 4308]KAI2834389.1 hypothetical protein CBS11232_10841 [Aspergillus niger]KAI2868182.1 hypothetical protein CBS115988_10865 [Aspergillus niger]
MLHTSHLALPFVFVLYIPFVWAWIQSLQIMDAVHGLPEGQPGYVRNFTPGTSGTNPILDDSPQALVCGDNQRVPLQQRQWPRLEALPGSLICPRYAPGTWHNGSAMGEIHWYGANIRDVPDQTTLAELRKSPLQAGEKSRVGDHDSSAVDAKTAELAEYAFPPDAGSECQHAFQVPAQATDLLTVYWMWNTTQRHRDGFLIYMACFDIHIILEHESDQLPTSKIHSTSHPSPGQASATPHTVHKTIENPSPSMNQGGLGPSFSAADWTGSVISATCSASLGLFCSPASPTLPSATAAGTGPQSTRPADTPTVSSALAMIASATWLPNPVGSDSWLRVHTTSTSPWRSRSLQDLTVSNTLATVTESDAPSTAALDTETVETSSTSTTLHTTSTGSRDDIGSASDTGPSQVRATATNNVGWGSIVESSYKTIVYCSFTERCGHPGISSSSLQSACEALVKDGCANPSVESNDFFGSLEFTANDQLTSCTDSAPLTIEGCQDGFRGAASYVDSQLARSGDLACAGFVNIANAAGDEAGAVTVSGICMPDFPA